LGKLIERERLSRECSARARKRGLQMPWGDKERKITDAWINDPLEVDQFVSREYQSRGGLGLRKSHLGRKRGRGGRYWFVGQIRSNSRVFPAKG